MSNIRSTNPTSPRTEHKRRGPSLQVSKSKTLVSPNSSRRANSVPPSKCVLCAKKIYGNKDNNHFATVMQKSLYTKYASSQNYYYTKDINELLSDSRTPVALRFKDWQCYDDMDEYLKRFYKASEYNNKVQLLTEYYKFHWDIPRLFMLPVTEVLNRFHDRKRRLQYIRVTKMLKEQKEAQNPAQKPHADPKTKPEEGKDKGIADPILAGLETSQSVMLKNEKPNKPKPESKEVSPRRSQAPKTQRQSTNNILVEDNTEVKLVLDKKAKEYNNKPQPQQKDIKREHKQKDDSNVRGRELSISHTLHDLNAKLGEIISGSEMKVADSNYLDMTENNLDGTISNLKNFLNYLTTTKTTESIRPLSGIGITKVQSGTQITNRPNLIINTQRPSVTKPNTPRQQQQDNKPREMPATTTEKKTNGPNIITWSRTDSIPLVTPVPNETARKELTSSVKNGEKASEGDRPIKLLASGRVSSESLSSTMTSKSKSVYSSITKIRNFDEAVKISQQGGGSTTQLKPGAPITGGPHLSAKMAHIQDGHGHGHNMNGNNIQHVHQDPHRRESPFDSVKNLDFSQKTPFNYWDERSKESKESSPTSKQSSHLLSPVIVKSSSKVFSSKNTNNSNNNNNPYNIKPLEYLPTKGQEASSPGLKNSQYRVKSHRELGSSLEKSSKESSNNNSKQIPQLQMSLAKGHNRFSSGSLLSSQQPNKTPSTKSSNNGGFVIQTGREIKNFMTIGSFDPQIQLKDARSMPNSARRETGTIKLDGKGDFISNSILRGTDGFMLATDREKESTPISPKVATTQRRFVYHKHTKSEGKLAKLDSFDPKTTDPRIKEMIRHGSLNDAADDAFSEVSQKTNKKGEVSGGKKIVTYNTANIGNLFLVSSSKDVYPSNDKTPTMGMTQRKQIKQNTEILVSPMSGTSGTRSPKPDVLVKKKNPLRKSENFGSDMKDLKQKVENYPPSISVANSDIKMGRMKTLSIKSPGHISASNFYKSTTVQIKGKGKIEL